MYILIKTGPEFRFVKQLVLVQIVKLRDFKTPISLYKTLCFKICTTTSCFTNLIPGPGSMNMITATMHPPSSEDRVLDGPASGGKGSKGRNELDCIRGKGHEAPYLPDGTLSVNPDRLEPLAAPPRLGFGRTWCRGCFAGVPRS